MNPKYKLLCTELQGLIKEHYSIDVPLHCFDGVAQSIGLRKEREFIKIKAKELGFVVLTQEEYRALKVIK